MKKKIFITIPWFLPAFRAGGPVQSVANLVRELPEEAEYFIFCGDTDINGAGLENIETGKWTHFNEHTRVWYAAPEKISDNLVKQVERQKPDILFITGMFSWHYNMVPIIFCRGPRKILSARGMLHPGALSQKKWKKKLYLQLFKLLEYHHAVHFHATDEEERDHIISRFGPPAKVFVAGNFPNKIAPLPVLQKKTDELKLVSIALISPMKNILQVLQALEKCTATIRYDIYGPVKDESYWDACRQQIRLLPENINVQYHREILPENIKEALAASHVFILPSKSENFSHALFEALSAGRPVITSHHTPWNHLKESHAGINISTGNKDELTGAIDFFSAMDEDVLLEWHNGAASYAGNAIDIEKIREQYRQMFTL